MESHSREQSDPEFSSQVWCHVLIQWESWAPAVGGGHAFPNCLADFEATGNPRVRNVTQSYDDGSPAPTQDSLIFHGWCLSRRDCRGMVCAGCALLLPGLKYQLGLSGKKMKYSTAWNVLELTSRVGISALLLSNGQITDFLESVSLSG